MVSLASVSPKLELLLKRPKLIWYAVFRRHADRIIAGQDLSAAPDFQVLIAFERFTPQVAEWPRGKKVCIDLLLAFKSFVS